jgi:hypothetical protein
VLTGIGNVAALNSATVRKHGQFERHSRGAKSHPGKRRPVAVNISATFIRKPIAAALPPVTITCRIL